jgi:hypothetical protein
MELHSAGPKLSLRWVRSDDSADDIKMLNTISVLIAIGVVEITFDPVGIPHKYA